MFLCILLCIIFYSICIHFLQKYQNLPPSPFPSLPVIGHLHLVLTKPLHRALFKISNRRGPVVFLQLGCRRVLLVSSPSAAEECLSTNDVIFANRPPLLTGKIIGYNYTSLAWSSYGEHWRTLRRIASMEILSPSRVQMLSSIRADEIKLLVRRLIKNGDRIVDMKLALFEMVLNMIMRTIAGKRYYGENMAGAEEARRLREIVDETLQIGVGANICDFLPFLRRIGLNQTEKRIVVVQEKRDKFMDSLIQEHKRTRADKGNECALIQVLLSLQETDPEYYKDETIRSLMLVLFAAGTDTSSVTLEWAMSLLLNNPEILQKAQVEIDKVVGRDRLLSESDLENLPYLHCIIKETMRMYPAGPIVPPYSLKKCHIGGYRVPPNTMLLVNLFSIQNDSKYWADATEFKPERFVGTKGARDGFRLMPFSSGRRGCPGENLAMRMVGLALGSLLQCFEWERTSEELVEMGEGTGLTMSKIQPLIAKCKPRLEALELISRS